MPHSPAPPGLLVIGYGNPLRSDDGAGQAVCEALAAAQLPGVQIKSCDLLTPELADPVSRAASVVFVDAALNLPGSIEFRLVTPATSSQVLGHAASPQLILALARDVYGVAPRAWWLTIPTENLDFGTEFSTRTRAGVSEAIQRIKDLVRELAGLS